MRAFPPSALALVLLAAAAGAAFAATCDEAELLALEIDGGLTPPPDLVAEVARDLALIRSAEPQLRDVVLTPSATPNELLIGLTPAAWEDFQAGTYDGLDDLNAVHGPVDVVARSGYLRLEFKGDDCLATAVLAGPYGAAPGVRWAEPNGLVGEPATDVLPLVPGVRDRTYLFVVGEGDCLAGCIEHRYWIYEVEAGAAVLLGSGSGSPRPAAPLSWGAVKGRYR